MLDPVESGITAVDWIDERTSLSPALRWILFRKVPRGTNWAYTLGSATMFAFLNQAVTGVFLAMYYKPDARAGRYESIRYINDNVFPASSCTPCTSGAPSVMIILIFLHMARTFFYGAYKYPRELTWVIGVVLLILTLAMGFTGYLLPFDQRSYWATIVGVNINGTGPFIGPFLSDFLRAGNEFGATTLSRFYAIHMLLIPGAIMALIGAHLYLVTRLGTTAPPWAKAKKDNPAIEVGSERVATVSPERSAMNQAEKEVYLREYSVLKNQGKPFFPYAVAKDGSMAAIVMMVIIMLALMFGAELGPKADPTTTTYVPRPDWYFYFLFEVLRVMKNVPMFTPMATIGVPTHLHDPALPAAVLRPQPGAADRAAAGGAGRRNPDHHGDGLPDLHRRQHGLAQLGRHGASHRAFRPARPRHSEPASSSWASPGCLACHEIGSNGNNGPGPNLTHVGSLLPAGSDRLDAAQPDAADAVLQESPAAEVPGTS